PSRAGHRKRKRPPPGAPAGGRPEGLANRAPLGREKRQPASVTGGAPRVEVGSPLIFAPDRREVGLAERATEQVQPGRQTFLAEPVRQGDRGIADEVPRGDERADRRNKVRRPALRELRP